MQAQAPWCGLDLDAPIPEAIFQKSPYRTGVEVSPSDLKHWVSRCVGHAGWEQKVLGKAEVVTDEVKEVYNKKKKAKMETRIVSAQAKARVKVATDNGTVERSALGAWTATMPVDGKWGTEAVLNAVKGAQTNAVKRALYACGDRFGARVSEWKEEDLRAAAKRHAGEQMERHGQWLTQVVGWINQLAKPEEAERREQWREGALAHIERVVRFEPDLEMVWGVKWREAVQAAGRPAG